MFLNVMLLLFPPCRCLQCLLMSWSLHDGFNNTSGKGTTLPQKRPRTNCIIHCSDDDSDFLVSPQDQIRQHGPLLELAKGLEKGTIPQELYHRKCRSIFTMKKARNSILSKGATSVAQATTRLPMDAPSSSAVYDRICIFATSQRTSTTALFDYISAGRSTHCAFYHWRPHLSIDCCISLKQFAEVGPVVSVVASFFPQQTENRTFCLVLQSWLTTSHCTDYYYVTSLFRLIVTCHCSLMT